MAIVSIRVQSVTPQDILNNKFDVLRTDLLRYTYLHTSGTLTVTNDQGVSGTINLYPVSSNSNYAFSSTSAITSFTNSDANTRVYTVSAGYYAIAIAPPTTPAAAVITYEFDFFTCPTALVDPLTDDFGVF